MEFLGYSIGASLEFLGYSIGASLELLSASCTSIRRFVHLGGPDMASSQNASTSRRQITVAVHLFRYNGEELARQTQGRRDSCTGPVLFFKRSCFNLFWGRELVRSVSYRSWPLRPFANIWCTCQRLTVLCRGLNNFMCYSTHNRAIRDELTRSLK